MLRRDFLKFLGLTGAAAAVPGALRAAQPENRVKNDTILAENESNLTENRPNEPENGSVQLEFDFGEHKVRISANEGDFTYTENRQIDYIMHRGVLDRFRSVPDYTDFSLDLFIDWIDDPDFHSKVKDTFEFDMTIRVDDVVYTLTDCVWDTLQWDMSQSTFAMTGRIKNMRITK